MYIIGLANQPETFGTLDLSDFDAAIVWEYESASSHTFKFYRDGSVVQNIVINSSTDAFYDYAIEVNGTSAWLIACNVNSIMNEPSPADGGSFSHTYEATSIEDTAPVTIHMAALNTTGDVSTTNIETITTPAAPATNLTNWSKALDFSGSNEHAIQVSNNSAVTPLQLQVGWTVNAPTTSGNTTDDLGGRPWATAVVFKSDFNSSNQHIWNQGEGAGSTDDNIHLRTDSNGMLYFGWGRQGALNECRISNQAITGWRAVYIAHTGERLSGANATAANLADCFDIRVVNPTNNWDLTYVYNVSTSANWITTGGRMDRSVIGDFTVGGRGSNRNFHGKIASMVVTTLPHDVAMPANAEIEMMISDPKKWLTDYKVGNVFRFPTSTGTTNNFQLNNGGSSFSTQVWLMGDGTSDSYSNMIRNQVNPADQNYTKLQLNSMVSNDIENVNIPGLT